MNTVHSNDVALWAGPECSFVRIGDTTRDQLSLTGHAERIDDLDAVAALGIRTMRYPLLWERVVRDANAVCDWSWGDIRLERLRNLGIKPIVGLLHHGSGPAFTNLVDPKFPELFAAYAAQVAQRYPWIESYTPINEPLTTARFSGLYGTWYPHGQSDDVFVKALLNQCRGTVLAMTAIREVNPHAQFLQTEDLGKVWSTPQLRYQADFENNRRWLSFDLLCGFVNAGHPLWNYLIEFGAGEAELHWFQDNACPPDILGFNYYVTSERFLDHRTERYPSSSIGGNSHVAYADIEAVRVRQEGLSGPQELLTEAWRRYGRPLAITEAQLGSSREEQLRWLIEIWQAAQKLRRKGVDIIAVTLWSMWGACDWDSLMVQTKNHYESGVWDIRASRPRPTALTHAAMHLAANGHFEHAVLDSPGWWRRPGRLLYPSVSSEEIPTLRHARLKKTSPRPILITGATGTLGQSFAEICNARGLHYVLLDRSALDIADTTSVLSAFIRHQPWAVINASGYVDVDKAAREEALCWRENVLGPEILAQECAKRGIAFITFSSDLVFERGGKNAYVESDLVAPTGVYGASKAEAEKRVMAAMADALVIRTSAFFGPWDIHNFLTRTLTALEAGETIEVRDDQIISPTYTPDLAHATLDLLIDSEKGIWHLANTRSTSWYNFAVMAANKAGLDTNRILPVIRDIAYSTVLSSERAWLMPCLEDALARYIHQEPWRRLMQTNQAVMRQDEMLSLMKSG